MENQSAQAQGHSNNAVAHQLKNEPAAGESGMAGPETHVMGRVREVVDNSRQVSQMKAFQRMVDTRPQQSNATGLPDNLKSGVEQLSGFSMDDVRVHYNSSEPARMQAHAFARGTDIHVAPGQEKHVAHEAWHVVQQKQARVRPTLQLKGQTLVNDDPALEREADVMGEKALGIVPFSSVALQKKATAAGGPVQRKVGFEVEVMLDLAKGRLLKDTDPLLDQDRGYKALAGNITKGKSIVSQGGWKLTPDGGDGNWYVEFITDAIDETADQDRLPAIMRNLSEYVNATFGALGQGDYVALPDNFVAGFNEHQQVRLDGNIHITGGVRVDKLIEMLKLIQTWDGNGNRPNAGQDERNMLNTATTSAEGNSNDPKYQGLVALLGNYIAGQLRYARLVPQGVKDRVHELRNDVDGYADIDYCVDANDIQTFMATGAVTDATALGLINARFGGTAPFYTALRAAIRSCAPPAAKLNVPILSRTGLGALRKKVNIADNEHDAFIGHVLEAAGLDWNARNNPLFPVGLNTPGNTGRTIEDNPDITITQWLTGILNKENKSFSDKTFGFENVGPATGACCWWNTYEQGAVMEIRALDGLVPVAGWENFATGIVTAFRGLNAADDD